ncbi:MAG: DUF1292 domain-containing protein [Clostridiales bacterium]|nr:DUF1292 domain-containing protein [Clostridiales bacterium]
MDKFDDFDELDDIEDFDEDDDIIIMEDEFGVSQEFFIIDGVNHKGINYLLVAPVDSDEDEYEAAIIRQTRSADNLTDIYEMIEEDVEFNEVAAIFASSEGDYEIDF